MPHPEITAHTVEPDNQPDAVLRHLLPTRPREQHVTNLLEEDVDPGAQQNPVLPDLSYLELLINSHLNSIQLN